MKRRGFLAALAGLPFVGMAAAPLTNAALKEVAAHNPPPPEWFAGETITASTASVTTWHADGTFTFDIFPVRFIK